MLTTELKHSIVPGPLGPMIEHPLLKEIIYAPEMDEHYNKVLAFKQKEIEEALEARDVHRYVWMHERPYRLQAFENLFGSFDNGGQYWKLLRDIWVDSENIHQNLRTWKKLLTDKTEGRHDFMTSAERKYLDKLPETITIYRGYRKSSKGYSYSLSKQKAQWFADRFSSKGKIKTLKVKKSDVFAYIGSRGEEEIIYLGK